MATSKRSRIAQEILSLSPTLSLAFELGQEYVETGLHHWCGATSHVHGRSRLGHVEKLQQEIARAKQRVWLAGGRTTS